MIYIDTSPAPLDDMSLPIVLFDNFYNKGTISWTSAVSGFPGSNVATESTFDYWAPNNAPVDLDKLSMSYITLRIVSDSRAICAVIPTCSR